MGRGAFALAGSLLITISAGGPAQAAEPAQGEAASISAPAELVMRALGLLGVNYKFGGNTPDSGMDCSGLVRYVFREAIGLPLPRRSEEMSRTGQSVRGDQLQPGDLVFFNTLRSAFSHVGIYIGNRQFVHAPTTGSSIRVDSLDQGYWKNRFNGARRLTLAEAEPVAQPAAPVRMATRPEQNWGPGMRTFQSMSPN